MNNMYYHWYIICDSMTVFEFDMPCKCPLKNCIEEKKERVVLKIHLLGPSSRKSLKTEIVFRNY